MGKQKQALREQKKHVGDISDAASIDVSLRFRAGAFFALLGLARFAASFFPDARLWGLNHAAYLSPWMTWVLLGISLVLCTPALYSVFHASGRLLFGPAQSSRSGFRIVTAAVLALFGFWFLRMHTYFLGDGAVYLAEIFRYMRDVPGSESVLYSKGSAPGTGWMLAHIAKVAYDAAAAPDSLLANPQFAFWITSAPAGAVFVGLAALAARDHFEHGGERFAAFLLLVAAPGVLFFFGYVEYYTLYYCAIGGYFWLLSRAANGGSLGAPVFALLLATAFHFMAVVALPSLLLVAFSRARHRRLASLAGVKPLLVFAALALIAGAVAYFALGIHEKGSRVVLSLYPFGREGAMQSYTLLSSWHLIDAVNYALLLAGPLVIGALFLFTRQAFTRVDTIAALANFIFMCFLAFFGNMGFGMARDWDINAGLGLASVFLLLALARAAHPSPARRYMLYLVSAASFAAVLPWIWVNVSTVSAVQRAKAVLALDDTHVAGDYALNGYEHMLKYFNSTGDTENAIWAVKKKIDMVGYPEDYKELALRTIQDAPVAVKRTNYDWLFDKVAAKLTSLNASGTDSSYSGSKSEYLELAGESLLQCRSLPAQWGFDEAYVESQYSRFAALAPDSPVIGLVRAQLDLTRSGVIADPGAYVRGARALGSSPTLAAYAGIGLASLNMHREAREALLLAVRLDTAFTLPLLYLAESEMQLGSAYFASAEEHLERFLATPEGWRVFGASGQREALAQKARVMLETVRR